MKICFFIACKVYKNYKSYLAFYVKNILNFYPNATILLVDNNSKYFEFYQQFKDEPNVIILENTSAQKFELGAYNFATKYIIDNNLQFDFYVCTQDNVVMVNNLDFNILIDHDIFACSTATFIFSRSQDLHIEVLSQLNLYDPDEKFLCNSWNSWIVNHANLLNIYQLTKSLIITTRHQSMQTERYMGKVLKMLNNNVSISIDGPSEFHTYNCFAVDPTTIEIKNDKYIFIKVVQNKTELTEE